MNKQPAPIMGIVLAAALLCGLALLIQLAGGRLQASVSMAQVLTPASQSARGDSSSVYKAGGGTFAFANPFAGKGFFELIWTRTDLAVKQGNVRRTWILGPGPNTPGLLEQYKEDPLGRGLRLVQYFDKGRLEMNNPYADSNTVGYVTNGLLSVEMISGFIQVGDNSFLPYHPACITMAGDPGDNLAPTYFVFQRVSNTQSGDHPSPNLTGHRVTATIDRDGNVSDDTSKARIAGTELVQYESETQHNIPAVFWDFINASGPVHRIIYTGNGLENERTLSEEGIAGFVAVGLPISEPYWSRATIKGKATDVMIQAYERWVLTYVPSNPKGFEVEVANIGQHYFDWCYNSAGMCSGAVLPTLAPPVLAPTGTIPPMTPTFGVPTYSPPTAVGSITPPPTLPLPTGTSTPLPTEIAIP